MALREQFCPQGWTARTSAEKLTAEGKKHLEDKEITFAPEVSGALITGESDRHHPLISTINAPMGVRDCCYVLLPHKATQAGTWKLRCNSCGVGMSFSVAGGESDPASVYMPCQLKVKRALDAQRQAI